MWGLERNIKTLQSERDSMQEKLKDCLSTFSGLRRAIGKVSLFYETSKKVNNLNQHVAVILWLISMVAVAPRFAVQNLNSL